MNHDVPESGIEENAAERCKRRGLPADDCTIVFCDLECALGGFDRSDPPCPARFPEGLEGCLRSPNSTAGAQVWSQRERLTVSLPKAPGGAGRSIADDVLSKHQHQQHISRRHIYDGIATILGCVSGLGSRRFRLACVVFRLSQRLPPKKKGAPALHGI